MSPASLQKVDFTQVLRTDPHLQLISRHAATLQGDLLLVGGAPRDLLLGRTPRDLDFILAAQEPQAQEFLQNLAESMEGRLIALGRDWKNEYRLVTSATELDFVVVKPDALPEEMARRDFTINAIAVRIPEGTVHDPLGGRRDLEGGLLRQAGPLSMEQDPLRIMRAVRLLAQGSARRIESQTLNAIQRAVPGLTSSAAERVGTEMDRIAGTPRFAAGLVLMQRWGVLQLILPVIRTLLGVAQNGYHHLDCWRHTVAVVRWVDRMEELSAGLTTPGVPPLPRPRGEDLLVLKYTALCHDLGKPATLTTGDDGRIHFYGHEKVSLDGVDVLAEHCRFSKRRTRRVRALVRNHLRPGALGKAASEKALRRLVHAAGEDLNLLILLSMADTGATRGDDFAQRHEDLLETCRNLLQVHENAGDELLAPRPLLTGRTVMRLTGLKPGPALGRALAALVQLQVEGEVSSREQAKRAVRKIVAGREGEQPDDCDSETS